MSTAREIIESSLRKLGVISYGESLEHEEANDSLKALKMMLSSWNTQGLIVYGKSMDGFTITSNVNTYTLGEGGDFDIDEPIKTDLVFYKSVSGVEYPVEIIDNEKWGNISYKNSTSTIPRFIYIDDNFPLKTVYLYPTPTESGTLIFHNNRKLSTDLTLNTELSLKDGYERAIVYNFAIEIAPEYGKSISGEISKIASESLSNIKRVNIKSRKAKIDPALLTRSTFDWRKGE